MINNKKLLFILCTVFQINANNVIPKFLSYDVLKSIKKHNRKTLSLVSEWISDEVYEKSNFKYGLPEHVRGDIDKPIGNDMTYSDLMLCLSHYISKPIRYLELGVSVGKNFFQVVNYLENSLCAGFEIEVINPTLQNLFTHEKELKSWDVKDEVKEKFDLKAMKSAYGEQYNWHWLEGTISKQWTLKKEICSLTEYKYELNNNNILYLSGDIFDSNAWKHLEGGKFNLIFSDAFHNIESIFFEFEMMKKYNVLDEEEFIILWDDMGSVMTTAVLKVWEQLFTKYQNKVLFKIVPIRGWLGGNEAYHQVVVMIKTK